MCSELAVCGILALQQKRWVAACARALTFFAWCSLTRPTKLILIYGEVSPARPTFFLILDVIGHQMRMSRVWLPLSSHPICQSLSHACLPSYWCINNIVVAMPIVWHCSSLSSPSAVLSNTYSSQSGYNIRLEQQWPGVCHCQVWPTFMRHTILLMHTVKDKTTIGFQDFQPMWSWSIH